MERAIVRDLESHILLFSDHLLMTVNVAANLYILTKTMISVLYDALATCIAGSDISSKGGRLVLIKSTLQSLPVFMLSCRLVPVTVLEEIERIIRRFFWGTTEGRRKYHLVAYESICLPFEMGGLGLRSIRELNVSLLCKWFWRLKEDALWVRLLKEKYGEDIGGFFIKKSRLPYGTSMWRGLKLVEELFRSMCKFEVGNGKSVSFWNDSWVLNKPLRRIFPQVYDASSTKGATVEAICLGPAAGSANWFLGLSQDFCEDNRELVNALVGLLKDVRLGEGRDSLSWLDGKKDFSVRICYNYVLKERLKFFSTGLFHFEWQRVWLDKVPTKFNLLLWLIIRGKLLTESTLQRKNVKLASRCSMCLSNEETISHLFGSCSLASRLWNFFLEHSCCYFMIQDPIEEKIRRWRWQWSGFSEQGKLLWQLLPHAVCSTLWEERNARIFDERESAFDKLVIRVKEFLWGWTADSRHMKNIRLEQLLFGWEQLLYAV